MTLLQIVTLVTQAWQLTEFSHSKKKKVVKAQTEASSLHSAKFLISVTGHHIDLGKNESEYTGQIAKRKKKLVSMYILPWHGMCIAFHPQIFL